MVSNELALTGKHGPLGQWWSNSPPFCDSVGVVRFFQPPEKAIAIFLKSQLSQYYYNYLGQIKQCRLYIIHFKCIEMESAFTCIKCETVMLLLFFQQSERKNKNKYTGVSMFWGN